MRKQSELNITHEMSAQMSRLAASEFSEERRKLLGPQLFNLTCLPAISLPCGFGPEGLPLGMQIITKPMEESRMFQVAYDCEQYARWFEHHPRFSPSRTAE